MSYLASTHKDVVELVDGSEAYHANIRMHVELAAAHLLEALSIALDVRSEDVLSQFRSGDGESYIGHI
jgi:hypothetical protein